MARLRQVLIFDRFLARVFTALGDRVVVKGGVVLELRLAKARTTRDVDLGLSGDLDRVPDALSRAGELDLGDWLSFVVEPDREHPTIDVEGMIYGGRRFRAEARLAGRLYGSPFGVDVAAGDVLTAAPEYLEGTSFLAFAGVDPGRFRVYPREAHVAEKLHAFTLPRSRPNSRVKDLPDLALLAETGPFDAATVRVAIEGTFRFRNVHPIPSRLPDPPPHWERPYAAMAARDELRWPTLAAVTAVVRAFMDPVLAGQTVGRWSPVDWNWTGGR